MEIEARTDAEGAKCSYCHDDVEKEPRSCPACGARYHAECLVDELDGACAVLGCATQIISATDPSFDCRHCGRGFLGAHPRTCRDCGARYHLDCLRGSLNGRCEQCSFPIGTHAPRRDAVEPAPSPEKSPEPLSARRPGWEPSPLPWRKLTGYGGLVLLVPAILVLGLQLAMADHGGIFDGLVGWAIGGAVVGGALFWLSTTGCPRCQHLFCARTMFKRDLGQRDETQQEFRDGRWRTVSRTVSRVEVTYGCRRCNHPWTQVRSRTLRERVGWW